MLKKYLGIIIFSLAGTVVVFAANSTESLTISTYYPAPYGVYRNLKLNPTDSVPSGAAKSEGVMYYDKSEHMPKYYNNTTWVNMSGAEGEGEYWSLNSTTDELHNTNAGNVGIGVVNPQEKLDVNGRMRIRSGWLDFYTPAADAGGTTGIVANPNGWSRIDPGNSRFIIPVARSRNSNILDVEKTDNWDHVFELRGDGSVEMNHHAAKSMPWVEYKGRSHNLDGGQVCCSDGGTVIAVMGNAGSTSGDDKNLNVWHQGGCAYVKEGSVAHDVNVEVWLTCMKF